jgi:hypothetical protein
MRIGVLGTGGVGSAIAGKLVALGHEVRMGGREAGNSKAVAWAAAAGKGASHGRFADAAAFGEIVFNCTAGIGALAALEQAGAANLAGKLLIDLSNPLDFSKGMPPSLTVSNTDSLGEQIQRAHPAAKVVKTLNTINSDLMVDPARLGGGEHDMFVAGNDAAAKAQATTILKEWFGWKHVIDLGDLTAARATEAYVLFWVRLYGTLGTPNFSVRVVR